MNRKRERGITLVMVALCLVVFMGMAALAVDLGVMYTARTSAQHAADAGALAGAYTFSNPSPVTATDAAVAVANQNNVMGTPAGVRTSDVTVTGDDVTGHRVTVVVPRTAGRGNPVTLYFARVLGWVSADIVASATAEALPFPTGGRCIKPIYIPNTVLSPALDAQTACGSGQTIFNPGAVGQTSLWFQSLAPGSALVLKPVNCNGSGCPTSDTLPPSQYYELDLGNGASTYRCLWSSCMTDPACAANQSMVECGTSYPILTGSKNGPTQQGVNNLICGPSGNCSTNPQDTWGGVGDYISPGGTASPVSRSLAVFPVWDDCTTTVNSGTNGQTVKVVGFVEVFVDGVDPVTNNVTGHLVRPLGCNAGNTSGTGPLAIPVRLVQPPPAS